MYKKTLAVLNGAAVLFSPAVFQMGDETSGKAAEYEYRAADLISVMDVFLGKTDAGELQGNSYDFDGDGSCNIRDICLLKSLLTEKTAGKEITVSGTGELKAALKNATAGDTILLAPGVYESSEYGPKAALFFSGAEGTETAPVTLKSADEDDPAVLKGTDPAKGIVLYITGDHWNIENIICCGAQKGIILDNSNYSVIRNAEVYNTGQEGIHLRDGSSYCEITGAEVHDTGLAGSYGEAVYIGSAKSTDGYVYECDNNIIKGCTLGPGVTDECVDIKEYTTGNIIENCVMYGGGMSAADSFVDIKGNRTTVRNNICYSQDNEIITDGFQVHSQLDGWGTDNVIEGNTVYFSGDTEYIARTWRGSSCKVSGNIRVPENSSSMYRAYSGSTLTVEQE